MRPEALKLVYIGGAGRSGSTILAQLVAAECGGVAVGELKDIWQAGILRNDLCGCGRRFRECEYWCAVGHEAFGGWGAVSAERLWGVQRRVDRFRNLPLLMHPQLLRRVDPGFHRDLTEYGKRLTTLYRAVKAISGCSVIVEGSKHPAQAVVLSAYTTVDVRVVHLVRDSRGVAWSFQKRVTRPEIVGTPTLMPHGSASHAARQWLLTNLAFHCVGFRELPSVRVKYEEYVRMGAKEIARVCRALHRDTPEAVCDPRDGPGVTFHATHTLGGTRFGSPRRP